MDGVKTAIIGFIFVCIIIPGLIRNRHQYYMGLAAVILAMVFQAVGLAFQSHGFDRYCYVLEKSLEIVAVLILVMAAGGLSARQLAGDMGRAIEVMRRGEETSEVLIPVPGHLRRSKEDREETRERVVLDDDDNDPLYDPKRFNPGQGKAAETGAIPVEGPEGDEKK